MHIRDGTFDVPFAILFILLLPTWRCPIVVKVRVFPGNRISPVYNVSRSGSGDNGTGQTCRTFDESLTATGTLSSRHPSTFDAA